MSLGEDLSALHFGDLPADRKHMFSASLHYGEVRSGQDCLQHWTVILFLPTTGAPSD